MLISYPVLGVVQIKESPYGGRYPLAVFKDSRHEGLTTGWHGGLHLEVNGTTTQGPVVRAIADGTVVAYRVPTCWVEKDGKRMLLDSHDPSLKDHILNYTGNWTDDGFVILKHEKECAEGRPVVFYSLYMHLSKISQGDLIARKDTPGKVISSPKKQVKTKGKTTEEEITIKRKEGMGEAGCIEGQTNQIHFEIFTGDEAFRKFFKVGEGSMDPWGELYFIIPAGQPVYQDKLGKGSQAQPVQSTPAELRIALRYQDGDIHFRSLDENGLELECWPMTGGEYLHEDCEGEEYELYGEAGKVDRGKLSRAYELLRFGRYLDWPDLANDKKPAAAHCWHEIPMLNGWVDFADEAIRKRSDADFLDWQWQTVSSGEAGFDPSNGLCKVSQLFSAMDENGEGHLTDIEFGDWRKHEENKALLSQLVVQFQSEWDGSEPDKRRGWVKAMWANPVQHETEALKNKIAWVQTQKAQAAKALPVLEQRVLQAKGWRSQVSTMKTDTEAALAKAQQAVDEARKARVAARSDPDAKHRVAAIKALDAASDARQRAEQPVKETAPMLAKAESWVAREETKYRAAQDAMAQADPLIAELQKNMEAAAKKTVDSNAAAQASKDFEDYKKYMKALQFWEQVPGLPDSKVWHFHPLAFIEFFRKCHWLSKGELEAIYPDGVYPKKPSINPDTSRNNHRVALNRVMWKYGITTPARQTHFLGQAGHECTFLSEMHEQGDSTYLSRYDHNGDLGNNAAGEGELFKGRGMKQLTGRYNYMRYWVYRGWLPSTWMFKKWTLNQKEKQKSAEEQAKIRKTFSSPPEISNPDPEALESVAFNAVDAGGWFWEAGANCRISINHRFKDGPLVSAGNIDTISKDINPGEKDPGKLKARREHEYIVYDTIGDELELKSEFWKKEIKK